MVKPEPRPARIVTNLGLLALALATLASAALLMRALFGYYHQASG